MLAHWQSVCDQISADDSGIASSDLNSYHGFAGPMNSSSPTIGGSFDQLNGYNGSMNPLTGVGGCSSSRNAFDTLSDRDSVSLHTHSITASHVEKTLSEVASSVSSPFPRPGPQDPAYTQMRIWLLSADLHLTQGNLQEAEMCVSEARQLSPLSYQLMFMRGRIHEEKGELEAARVCYENSLSINPTHVSSLLHLGRVYFQLGFFRLAEQSLKIAVRTDPNNEKLWTLLGEVKEAIATEILTMADDMSHQEVMLREEAERTPTEATNRTLVDEATRMFSRASECQAIALSLQASSPILPFTTVPMCFE